MKPKILSNKRHRNIESFLKAIQRIKASQLIPSGSPSPE